MNNILKIAVLLMVVFAWSVDAKLYKWVDEDGKVHYSDKIPPDQIKNARQELNEHGVVTESIKRALTDEEKIAKAEELRKERELQEQKRLEAERIEKERNALLKSYSSADQIRRLKSERILALKRNIEMAEENLIIQRKNLDDLLKRAADKERSGQVVPKNFLDQIEQIRTQIEIQKSFIEDKSNEIESTETKYDYDLTKYLEYTQNIE